jgi:hypothetical protein
MTTPPTNLEILQPSRRRLLPGDIFVFRVAGHPYHFGRVIKPRIDLVGMPATLIYLYRAASEDPIVVPALHCNELLVPPLFTNRLPWSRGYFVTVSNAALTRWDTLPSHVFRDPEGTFVDEYGRPTRDPNRPVELFALHSVRTIDDRISEALGIPLAPCD